MGLAQFYAAEREPGTYTYVGDSGSLVGGGRVVLRGGRVMEIAPVRVPLFRLARERDADRGVEVRVRSGGGVIVRELGASSVEDEEASLVEGLGLVRREDHGAVASAAGEPPAEDIAQVAGLAREQAVPYRERRRRIKERAADARVERESVVERVGRIREEPGAVVADVVRDAFRGRGRADADRDEADAGGGELGPAPLELDEQLLAEGSPEASEEGDDVDAVARELRAERRRSAVDVERGQIRDRGEVREAPRGRRHVAAEHHRRRAAAVRVVASRGADVAPPQRGARRGAGRDERTGAQRAQAEDRAPHRRRGGARRRTARRACVDRARDATSRADRTQCARDEPGEP